MTQIIYPTGVEHKILLTLIFSSVVVYVEDWHMNYIVLIKS